MERNEYENMKQKVAAEQSDQFGPIDGQTRQQL
jgi:hypothetical protein